MPDRVRVLSASRTSARPLSIGRAAPSIQAEIAKDSSELNIVSPVWPSATHEDETWGRPCIRIAEGRSLRQEVRTFATTTSGLLALADWLSAEGVTHVVMESTGVYWQPVWHVLEGTFELTLVNARHVRNVSGRKTDVNDSMWLADLLAHGLVQGSFVPPEPIQEARDLTRTRTQVNDSTGKVWKSAKLTLQKPPTWAKKALPDHE